MILKKPNIDTAACILSGLMLTAAFPDINLPFCAWFAFIPLLFAVKDKTPARCFGLGFCAGLAHFLTLIYWLSHTMQNYGRMPFFLSIPVLFLISAYFALYTGLFAALISKFSKKPAFLPAAAPVLWVSLEYIRSFIFTGLPWGLTGYSQFRQINLIQICDIFGVYAVSFLILFTNSVLFIVILYFTRQRWNKILITKKTAVSCLIISVFIFSIVWSYGKYRVSYFDKIISKADKIKISLIQGNIDQSIKWVPQFQTDVINKYLLLSQKAAKKKPDIMVWPETAVPFCYENKYYEELTELVKKEIESAKADFIIGSNSFVRYNNSVKFYNSAYLTDKTGKTTGRYDKNHLVPFGEYVPLKEFFPFIRKMVAQIGDFIPGTKQNTLKSGNYRIGTLICGEMIFTDLCAKIVENNADVLVNITNDAWFGKTSAAMQHFSMSVFRAVENRRSVARCANTGISGFIDPAGRISASSPIFQDAAITGSAAIISEKTLYTKFGDVFAVCCFLITALGITIISNSDSTNKSTL